MGDGTFECHRYFVGGGRLLEEAEPVVFSIFFTSFSQALLL